MVSVLVPIADGSEEIEAVTIIDVLRRAGAEVTVASVMANRGVVASRGVNLVAECLITECAGKAWDAIALPGGMPGAEHLSGNEVLMTLVREQLVSDRVLGAICAAPAVVLGRHDLLQNRTATCYPGFQQELHAKVEHLVHQRVAIDGKLITSQGPGTAAEFALNIVAALFGDEKAAQVAAGMLTNF